MHALKGWKNVKKHVLKRVLNVASTKVCVTNQTYTHIIYINSLGACVRASVRPSVRRDSSAF